MKYKWHLNYEKTLIFICNKRNLNYNDEVIFFVFPTNVF